VFYESAEESTNGLSSVSIEQKYLRKVR